MVNYTKEEKSQVLRRLQPPENLSVTALSKKDGIPESTIYGWIKQVQKGKSAKNWTSEEKFYIVRETFALNEAELAEYARKKGLFLLEIKEWKENCCTVNGSKSTKAKSLVDSKKNEKSLKEELKSCEKELNSKNKQLIRKEKALEEVTTLLVLKGKAQAIWVGRMICA